MCFPEGGVIFPTESRGTEGEREEQAAFHPCSLWELLEERRREPSLVIMLVQIDPRSLSLMLRLVHTPEPPPEGIFKRFWSPGLIPD